MQFFARLLTAIVAICVLGIGAYFVVSNSAAILPPDVTVRVGEDAIERYHIAESGSLVLTVETDASSDRSEATLFLFGLPIETIALSAGSVRFRPVLLAPDENEAVLKVTRRIGPFTTSTWRRFVLVAPWPTREFTLNTPEQVWGNRITVRGTAPSDHRVRLLVDGDEAQVANVRPAAQTSHEVQVDLAGRYEATLSVPTPGTYDVTAVLLSNATGDTIASRTANVVFESHLPPIRARSLVVFVGTEEIRYQNTLALELHDPRVAAVVRGGVANNAGFFALSGRVRIDNRTYGGVVIDPPRITITEDAVEIEQVTRRVPPTVLSDQEFEISRFADSHVVATSDQIEVKFADMRPVGFSPVADAADLESILWTNDSGALPDRVTISVQPVDVALQPWRIAPRDLLPSPLTSLLFSILSAFPLLWFLRIVTDPKNSLGKERELLGSLYALGALICFSTMTFLPHAISQTLPALNDEAASRRLAFLDPIRPYEIGLLFGYVVLLTLFAIWRIAAARRPWLTPANDARTILFKAFVWGLVFNVLWVVTLHFGSLEEAPDGLVNGAIWLFTFLVCVLIAWRMTLGLVKTARQTSGRPLTPAAPLMLAAVAILALLALPGQIAFDPIVEPFRRPLNDAMNLVQRFVGQLGAIAPLLVAFLICSFLANGHRPQNQDFDRTIATILFAGVLVGMGSVWIVFPVPFLLALIVFPGFVLLRGDRAETLATYRSEIFANRDRFLLRELENAKQYVPGMSWFGLGIFGLRQEDQKRRRDYAPLSGKTPDGKSLGLAELAFAFGGSIKPFANAISAVRIGLWGAVVFVVIYAIPSFGTTGSDGRFPYLAALLRVVSVGGYWLVGAFFFGYYYDQIRGSAGWKKGATVGIGIALASEPLAVINAQTAADYAAITIRSLQSLAFFTVIGLCFDVRAFARAAGDAVDWRFFPLIAGFSIVEAVASILLAGVGVAITTALTGQLTDVLGQVASELIQVPDQREFVQQP